jgi:hypothetical protein
MAVSTVHVLHGIVNASTFISQINSANPITNIERLVAESAGLPYPLFTATMGVHPAIPFESPQLTTILNLSGALSSIVNLSAANTDLYYKRVDDLGRRIADASLAHKQFRMSQAYLTLDSITASNRGEATARCRLGTTFDGTNAPLIPTGSKALAGTPISPDHFVVGPVSLNGSVLAGVEDTTIELNRTLYELSSDGEIYPTFAAQRFYSPVVTIRCYEHVWDSFGILGNALTAGVFYLRRVASNGRVPDGTASHIKFTADTGTIHMEDASGGGNDPSMVTVRCTLVSANASAEPIAVNTASAIT